MAFCDPRRQRVTTGVPGALLLLALTVGVPAALAQECTDCHGRKPNSSWRSVHEPFGDQDCSSCHEEHGPTGALVLAEEGNELCTSCHEPDDEAAAAAHRRLPVGKVPCLSCHHPHASEKIKLLRPNIHRPLTYGECADCHREDGQLRAKTVALLCYRCHDPKGFTGASRHEPVADGDCTSCHDPHGSRFPVLVTASYPLDRYVSYSEGVYGLCFSCHETSSLTEPGPDAETGFKDGRDNLHYRHTVKQGVSSTGGVTRDGMTCRNCHLPHASSRPHLIRESLDCGQGVLCLRLVYTGKEDGGGTCMAGCHKSATYGTVRVEAGATPAAVATSGLVVESPCLVCHQDVGESYRSLPTLHDPVRRQRCEACHLNHREENRLMLVSYEAKLCSPCHDEGSESFVEAHGGYAAAGSRCLRCHDPHASEEKGLLLPVAHEPFGDRSCGDCHGEGPSWAIDRSVNELCADCHDEQGSQPHLHGATEKQTCLGCHDPHAAKLGKLLPAEDAALCWRCHDRAGFTRNNRHEPVDSGDCASCHEVHGSSAAMILTGAYPLERYLDFSPQAYALCLSCHDEEPFKDARSSDTAFRDGDVNLHQLHVNSTPPDPRTGRKGATGMSCRNCHEAHSSNQPSLVRQSLDCGGVPCLNLEFRKTGAGSSCARGCHTPKTYVPSR